MLDDVRAMVVDRGHGGPVYLLSAILKVALYPRIQAVLLFRISHRLYKWRLYPLAYLLQAVGLVLAGAEIHPEAEIGPGLCLVHSSGIVIGNRVKAGAGLVCFHGVTLGDSGKGGGQPTLGDRVTVCAGAKVLGAVTIGDGATIGANAVVLCDVPAGGVAVGVPARLVDREARA